MVAVVLVVLFGLWPGPLLELTQTSSASFFDGLVNAAHHVPGAG
jgi:hypothetical protein